MQASLRAIYETYAFGDGAIGDELHSTKLLEYHEWRLLLLHAQIVHDIDFREREIALSFVWSRMRVVDLRPLKSRVKLTQRSFEDCTRLRMIGSDRSRHIMSSRHARATSRCLTRPSRSLAHRPAAIRSAS